MLTREKVNEILGVSESYKLPDKIMNMIFEEPSKLYDFVKDEDMAVDFFCDYFQECQGDRDALKQDFTPDAIGKIITGIIDYEPKTIADVCAGTGSLIIQAWAKFPDAFFTCFEVSERTIPFLLLNLMARNISGEVVRKDILTGEVFQVYRLEKNLCFSKITKKSSQSVSKFDVVISNPPYSLKWSGLNHEDFFGYEIAPKSKADYAFVLHSLAMVKEGGKVIEVLPHGVLFRGAKEGEVRKRLIENDKLDAVIGLPSKLFLNTSIPVCLMVLKSDSHNTLIMDASKLCVSKPKQNKMSIDHIDKVISAYRLRESVKKLSQLVTIKQISDNDFNLNIPRYVDTFEPEPLPSLKKVAEELQSLNEQIKKTESDLREMIGSLVSNSDEADEDLKYLRLCFEVKDNV